MNDRHTSPYLLMRLDALLSDEDADNETIRDAAQDVCSCRDLWQIDNVRTALEDILVATRIDSDTVELSLEALSDIRAYAELALAKVVHA